MARKDIKEIYLIRSVACLCVVFVHSITRIIHLYEDTLSSNSEFIYMTLRLIFTFGTPIFIFLSEFLLAYSYPNGIPKDFLSKRVSYILFPYISMSFLYGAVMVFEEGLNGSALFTYITYLIKNLIFGFYRHGYFILVIFQFYFIHMLFHEKLRQWDTKRVLLITFIVNVIYLGFFSFIEPIEMPFGEYLWDGLSWGVFPAWIFYFTLGFYIGEKYDYFKSLLKKHVKLVTAMPIFTCGLLLYFETNSIITIDSSKRVDMIFFATSMIFLLFYIAIYKIKIPRLTQWLSGYSFGIYLFHMLFLASLTGWLMGTGYMQINPVVVLLFLFSISTFGSIFLTYIIGKLPMGYFVVGKTPSVKPIIILQRYSKLNK